jgi:ribosome biogenesis protein BMS1
MGVLTHLDSPKFKTNNNGVKKLRKTKKRLKQRFWTEIYQGAKLFYLSGLINGKYPNNEILNLSRFISVMKFRPLIWRNTHPYLLADRLEDLTPEDQIHSTDRKCDRAVALYGYVRGTNLKLGMRAHIPGLGDVEIENLTHLPDPCPPPSSNPGAKKPKKRLDERQKLLHAPMCDVGGILYDKDAIYISVPGNFTKSAANEDGDLPDDLHARDRTDGEKMIMSLQDVSSTLADGIGRSTIRLLNTSRPVTGAEAVDLFNNHDSQEEVYDGSTGRLRRKVLFDGDDEDHGDSEEEDDDEDDDDDGSEDDDDLEGGNEIAYDDFKLLNGRSGSSEVLHDDSEHVAYADSDSDIGELTADDSVSVGDAVTDNSIGPRWKDELPDKAAARFGKQRLNLMDLVYKEGGTVSTSSAQEDSKSDLDGFLKVVKPKQLYDFATEWNSTKTNYSGLLDSWKDPGQLQALKGRFITGSCDKHAEDNGEEENHGDFEDLEDSDSIPEKEYDHAISETVGNKKEELKRKFDAEYDGVKMDEGEKPPLNFYEETKQSMGRQLDVNRQEFADDSPEMRALIEGHKPGQYVRVIIKNVPPEFVDFFDPHYPVIIGGLLQSEDKFGFIQVRIKRHRWHKRILKTSDPLIFSVGWRRFQSVPIYSLNDGTRNRMLKYTPEHMHCLATIYGPITPPNTGFCCIQSAGERLVRLRLVLNVISFK